MKKGSMFGRQVFYALSFAVAWAAVSSAAEDVWHWRAERKSNGNYYLVSYPENWTNETESITGTPPRGARVVIDAPNISTSNGNHPPWGDVNWKSGGASQFMLCVTSGAPIKVRCAPFSTAGLYLYGDGETFIDSNQDLRFQKKLCGNGGKSHVRQERVVEIDLLLPGRKP